MIDEIDGKILEILQEKARIPNVEVARRVGMAPSAVLERIRKLERNGIIDGYEVRLNPDRFMRSLVAFVFVKTDLGERDAEKVGGALAELPEAQEVHFLSGGDGYMAKVRVADASALFALSREKVGTIRGVRSVETRISMSTLKETSRIPLEGLRSQAE